MGACMCAVNLIPLRTASGFVTDGVADRAQA